jgi:hypothetical protein
MPNLILLCGTGTTGCHGEVHKRGEADWERGYWLRTWQDPRQKLVWYGSDLAASSVWYLHGDGSLDVTPELLNCPLCGHHLPTGASRCDGCGAGIKPEMYGGK